MRLKRFFILFMQITSFVVAFAQTQQGYVKTLGRPDKKGEALSGVSVRVKGGHNAVLSKTDGTFSVLMSGKKNGDAYSLQQVQKSGYELNEQGVIGRQYAFSDRIPLTIVMVSTAQLQADKLRIENNAYQMAERNYKARLAQLEEQKDDKAITIEEYRQRLLDLQDKFEKYQSLIDDLADHYAHVDYDNLDEKEREINLCIENGDLERADSLIHTLFDPTDVLKRNKEAIDKIEQQESQAREILAQANADMTAVLKQQEKDAEYLYQLYTIALAKFDNERARFYIETRAELDSTNSAWQCKAGEFNLLYASNLESAVTYLERGLRFADSRPEYYSYKWQYYQLLGHVFVEKSKLQDAVEYFRNALEDNYVKNGDDISSKASVCSSLATTLYRMGDYRNASDYLGKTINIYDSLYSSGRNTTLASGSFLSAYALMAQIFSDMGQYDEASKIFKQAMCLTKDKIYLGKIYSNYGVLLRRQKKYDEAMDMYRKAMDIVVVIYGTSHPFLGRLYGNMGAICMEKGQHGEAEDYFKKALENLINIYGIDNINVAGVFSNMGSLKSCQEKWLDAIQFYEKALGIYFKLIGDSHSQTAICYHGLGLCYVKSGDRDKGVQFMEKALAIIKVKMGDNHPYVKEIEKDIDEAR